jgi:hypothetical protein
MNKGTQKMTLHARKGTNLRLVDSKRIETGKNYRLGYIDTHLWPLTTLCDNIWLHRGWHAPCELPRMCNSSALVVGLWSLAQNFC